jgi:Protein of unknown function (DUF4236)
MPSASKAKVLRKRAKRYDLLRANAIDLACRKFLQSRNPRPMGLRFRRTLHMIPGLWLNAGKRSISASIVGHGATLNISKKGVQGTAGLPGSGVSYRTKRRKIGSSARPLATRHSSACATA